ncbi:MAG: AMP-binding protein [Actinomycetes bacterium]
MIRSAHIDTFTRDNLPRTDLWPEMINIPSYPERINACVELLDRTIELVGAEKIALIAAEGEISYGALLNQVKSLANFFEASGVQPGNRVLLRGPNNASVVALWFALLRIGAVVVTTIHLQRTGELEKIIDIADVQFACIDHRYLDEWNAVTNFDGETFIYGSGSENDILRKSLEHASDHTPSDTASDDVSLLAFTSGSTGLPKATMHFHRDILTIADTFAKHVLQPKSSDVFAGSPPLAFTFGLGALVIFPFRVGATSLLLEGAPPPVLLKEIAKHGVTTLFTAPTAYRAMLGHLAETPLPYLHTCVSAGEHLPKSTWEAWHKATGIRIIDGIGATEMLHIFISASGEEIIPGMTGKVVPGYEAIVVDEELHEVPDGEVGRLAVKGPTGCRYLHDERQRNYVEGGWNLTGDLYIKHPNGYFQYQSRSDDMIISSGYNVAAPEVENALLLHPAVAECAVVGLPDEERGMIVAAYVVLKSEAQASDELRTLLQNHVKETIVPFKYPRVLEFVTELPKTTTGKLQRFRLKS